MTDQSGMSEVMGGGGDGQIMTSPTVSPRAGNLLERSNKSPIVSPRRSALASSAPALPSINRRQGEQGAKTGLSTAARISMAYGRPEKLKILSAKHNPETPFELRSERDDELVGRGFSRDGQFHFLALDGEQVLVLPLADLARAKRK